MKIPPRPTWAQTTIACGIIAAAALPALGADALTPADGEKIAPNGIACMSAGTADPEANIIVNVTPVEADGGGNAMLAPGLTRPTRESANVNFGPGTVDPNLSIVPNMVPDEGICFKNSKHTSVHVVMDRLGTITGDAFRPATDEGEPVRLADTRTAKTPVGPNGRVCFSETPNATLVLNVTPVNATADGYGVMVPGSATTVPTAASVNYKAGSVNPNLTIARTDASGSYCFANSAKATTDVVIDLVGHIVSDFTAPSATGAPARLLDTRTDPAGKIQPGEIRCFAVPGDPGDGAVINLTPVQASAEAWGQLFSSDVVPQTKFANVNFAPGTVDPNVAIPEIGADGKVCFFNTFAASVHLVADHLGNFDDSVFEASPLDGSVDIRYDSRPIRPVPSS